MLLSPCRHEKEIIAMAGINRDQPAFAYISGVIVLERALCID